MTIFTCIHYNRNKSSLVPGVFRPVYRNMTTLESATNVKSKNVLRVHRRRALTRNKHTHTTTTWL